MLTRDPKPPDKGRQSPGDQEDRDQGFYHDLSSDEFEVRRSLVYLRDYLASLQVSPGGIERIELICAEAMNNSVEHGYDFKKGQPIGLTCHLDGATATLRISDKGNPIPDKLIRNSTMPDPQDYRAVLREGGWGWALIHHLCSQISYRRDRGVNLLTLQVDLAEDR